MKEHHILWNHFASDELIEQIRNVAVNQKDKFTPTTVSTGVPGYRSSKVLWHYEYLELYKSFTDRIRAVLPIISGRFSIPLNPEIELQMTVSGDGDFFKRHQDNGTQDTELRVLTYVYYFNMTDTQGFTGGNLVIDTPSDQITIEPQHNSLVIFRSELWHELMPVSQPSGKWEDSRSTLNGWIRRTSV